MATDDDAGEPRAKRSRGALAAVVMGVVVLMPLLYVLSVGPSVWLMEHAALDEAPFQVVYAPLIWLHEHVPAVQPPLDAYVSLFEK